LTCRNGHKTTQSFYCGPLSTIYYLLSTIENYW